MNILSDKIMSVIKMEQQTTMRQSSRNAVSYHAPQTEAFPDGAGSDATAASAEQARSHEPDESPVSDDAAQPPAPASSEDHAIPLQRGPIGTFYQPSPPYPSASNKGMNAGEKHALAAGFFVMLSLAAAFGIGWWATLPPAPALASGERSTTQAKVWTPAEEESAAPQSSGSSELAGQAGESTAAGDAMKALTLEIPAVNEISLSRLGEKKESSSDAAAAAPNEKSERASGQAARDTRDEEVSRMKAEAYSETRKDRLDSSTPSKPSSKEDGIKRQPASLSDSVSSTQQADLRRALAKCKNEDGLFYQERCKWRLCNGQWGKNGCPSYGENKRNDYSVS
jgi:hypothetical protein